MRYFKVGGLSFFRIGRLQVSWCLVKPRRAKRVSVASVPLTSYANDN